MDSHLYHWAAVSLQVAFTVLACAQQLMNSDAVNQTWETSAKLCSTILFN